MTESKNAADGTRHPRHTPKRVYVRTADRTDTEVAGQLLRELGLLRALQDGPNDGAAPLRRTDGTV